MEKIICIILLILYGLVMLAMCYIAVFPKEKNNIHFYVARDKNGELWLYIGKPIRSNTKFVHSRRKRVFVLTRYNFKYFGLNENDYANLRWEDEPLEVFVNMED